MATDRPLSQELAFPADDDPNDARWLASLIDALRRQIAEAGHPEVCAILDEAHDAAQAAADAAERVKLQ